MYVCICNAITDQEIRSAAEDGATNLWDLQSTLGVAAGCGSCKRHAMDVLREHQQGENFEPAAPRMFSPSAA